MGHYVVLYRSVNILIHRLSRCTAAHKTPRQAVKGERAGKAVRAERAEGSSQPYDTGLAF